MFQFCFVLISSGVLMRIRLFGYDQGVMGGLLTLNSFITTFPQIDTTVAGELGLSAAEKSTRSTVQGRPIRI